MRCFVRGDPGLVGDVAMRLTGSADLYQDRGHRPTNSINFITCHDGFTLADLVTYDHKHNDANGEGNRDGNDDNMSWNCGAEGPTGDPDIHALRIRQMKNFAGLLLLSRGVPMLTGGDEFGRTQHGNNNAYCQDNEIGWLDWSLAEANVELLSFWRRMIAFRRAHRVLWQPNYFTGQPVDGGVADLTWHGTRIGAPGWNDPDARTIACTLGGVGGGPALHIIANMFWEPLDFEIPAIPGCGWARAIDTSLPAGVDIAEPGAEPVVYTATYTASGRSVIVLISRPST
jgi:glycogen operon protein